MNGELTIRNRQRVCRINSRWLRGLVLELLRESFDLEQVELGVSIVGATEMARVNWQFLQHEGSTDVITFDHSETQESRKPPGSVRRIHGELYVCVDDALLQAEQFRTTWQAELLRYVVHGILHLVGYDDRTEAERRRMKREENRLMRALARQYSIRELGER